MSEPGSDDLLSRLGLVRLRRLEAVRSEYREVLNKMDATTADAARLRSELAAHAAESENLRSRLRRLESEAAKRDELLRELARSHEQKEEEITRLESATAQRERALAERDELLREFTRSHEQKDEVIARLESATAQREHALAESLRQREQEILRLADVVSERDRAWADLSAVLQERNRTLEELTSELREKTRFMQALEELQKEAGATLAGFDRSLVRIGGAITQLSTRFRESSGNKAPASRNWVLAVSEIQRRLQDFSGLREARALLETYYASEQDPNLDRLFAVYDQALAEGLPYWDIRTAARVTAAVLNPRTYLEVGVRRGWSLAQVFAASPRVSAWGFELWIPGYGDFEQAGPEAVRGVLRRIGNEAEPKLSFIEGNSHDTLPDFFAGKHGRGPQEFDLITVDGDHSLLGAWWDLLDLFPRVAPGGALLFDDLEIEGDGHAGINPRGRQERPPLPPGIKSLGDVWLAIQSRHPDFLFLTCTRLAYRTGIALRMP